VQDDDDRVVGKRKLCKRPLVQLAARPRADERDHALMVADAEFVEARAGNELQDDARVVGGCAQLAQTLRVPRARGDEQAPDASGPDRLEGRAPAADGLRSAGGRPSVRIPARAPAASPGHAGPATGPTAATARQPAPSPVSPSPSGRVALT